MKIKYVANDGSEFDTEEAAKQYEEEQEASMPLMWNWDGERVKDIEDAFLLYMPSGKPSKHCRFWSNWIFHRISNNYQWYYWDRFDEIYEPITDDMKHFIKKFMDALQEVEKEQE